MESAKIGDMIVKDLIALTHYYSKRLEFGKENLDKKELEREESSGALQVDNFSQGSDDMFEKKKKLESSDSVDSLG